MFSFLNPSISMYVLIFQPLFMVWINLYKYQTILGSWLTNLAHFLASYNFAKTDNLEKYLTGGYNISLGICHPNISLRSPFTVDILFLSAPIFGPVAEFGQFKPFCTSFYIFLQIFLGSKKVARMMIILWHVIELM